jgi:hypothetical protein
MQDIKNAIYDDGHLWIAIVGTQRSGKSSLALKLAYNVYKDWEQARQSVVFNLNSLLHRMETQKPTVWPTKTPIVHKRVPLLIYDDFGVHSNKADTQHSSAWDIFKGGSDSIGTKLGVLLLTMVKADEATVQLQNKLHGTITIKTKGKYTYNRIDWQEDFYGHRTKIRKVLTEHGEFTPIPKEVYQDYDQERQALVDEVFIRIKDALSTDSIDRILKLLRPEDETVLRLIDEQGAIIYDKAYEKVITRCKSRDLIISIPQQGKHTKYDLTQLGKDILMMIDSEEKIGQKIANRRTKQ